MDGLAWLGSVWLCFPQVWLSRSIAALLQLTIRAVRIAGGIVLILFVNNEASVSYTIAALVLQGTGVFPLILCTIGLLRLMLVCSVFVQHLN